MIVNQYYIMIINHIIKCLLTITNLMMGEKQCSWSNPIIFIALSERPSPVPSTRDPHAPGTSLTKALVNLWHTSERNTRIKLIQIMYNIKSHIYHISHIIYQIKNQIIYHIKSYHISKIKHHVSCILSNQIKSYHKYMFIISW
jgi:hypothetical protein